MKVFHMTRSDAFKFQLQKMINLKKKGISEREIFVHPKMKILSVFTHPHVVPTP